MAFAELESLIRAQFAVEYDGMHGASHWARVRENGLRLAQLTAAKPKVVELFALFHDSKRRNNGDDPQHGPRAARYARSLAGSAFALEPADLELLAAACHGHSDGLMTGDITVLTCWDADRLDLGRVGIRPRPERLCTAAAREAGLIAWAYQRSIGGKGARR
jgi:uncharacterized protein